jgi:hypothetical protein
MKGLFRKVIGVIAGLVAFSGISVVNVTASVPNVTASLTDISRKSPLYLEHGKSIGSSMGTIICDHESHASHASHGSHRSHSSGW